MLHKQTGANAGIVAFGSTEAAVLEAQDILRLEHDLPADFLRVRALPFTDAVREFVATHAPIFVVEMNRDGQLAQLLSIEYPEHATAFRSVAYQDGLPAAASWVRDGILAQQQAWISTAKPRPRTGRGAASTQAQRGPKRRPAAKSSSRSSSAAKRKAK